MATIERDRLMPPELTPEDAEIVRAAQRLIMESLDHSRAASITVVSEDGSTPTVSVPPAVLRFIGQTLGLIARRQPIVLMPQKQEMSTVEVANFLNVSRPFVIKEIEAGRLKHRKVGSHRGNAQQGSRAFHRDGKTISEISRLTSLSRNTIKRWLKAPAAAVPVYRRRGRTNQLTPFVKRLVQMLTADAQRVKRERRTARALHGQLKAEGYAGGYTRLTDFVRGWHVAQGKLSTTAAFLPLRFKAGEAFQFDWSEEGLVTGGLYRAAR